MDGMESVKLGASQIALGRIQVREAVSSRLTSQAILDVARASKRGRLSHSRLERAAASHATSEAEEYRFQNDEMDDAMFIAFNVSNGSRRTLAREIKRALWRLRLGDDTGKLLAYATEAVGFEEVAKAIMHWPGSSLVALLTHEDNPTCRTLICLVGKARSAQRESGA